MASELAFFPVENEDQPGWEQSQQLQEQQRWEGESRAQALAVRVAREILAVSLASWITADAAEAYQRSAEIVLREASTS